MIQLKNVNKFYFKDLPNEVHALKNVSININQGDYVAIMGPSGSGKSTLLHILAGVEDITIGDYIIDGINVKTSKDRVRATIRNKKIGIVLQDFGLLNDQSVIQNVKIPMMIAGINNSTANKKSKEILDLLHIGDIYKERVAYLSGGQKQRVAIARALVMGANVLLADEPTGALDTKTTTDLMNLLSEINNNGTTIILVTHNEKVADFAKYQMSMVDGVLS